MSNWLEQARTTLPQPNLAELQKCFDNAVITQCQDEIIVEIRESKNDR